MQPPCETADRL